MTKITVIGNSHIGALKLGWDRIAAEHPGVEVEFFGMVKGFQTHCRLTEALTYGLDPDQATVTVRKQALAVNSALEVDLQGSDAVLWAGHELDLNRFDRLAMDYAVDGLADWDTDRRLSRAAFETIVDDALAGYLPDAAWRNWAPPRPRLVVALKPFLSEGVKSDANLAKYPFWANWVAHNDRYPRFFQAVIDRFAGQLDAVGIGFLPQPTETLTPETLTRDEFRRGARKLFAVQSQSEDDVTHMNGEYGAAVLRALLARVQAA